MDGRCTPLVVELDVTDVQTSVDFYRSLGFAVAVKRPERRFAYVTRDGCVDVMLQASDGPGERVRTAALERPFGRGVCLLVPCSDVDVVHAAFVAAGGEPQTEIHERRYDVDVLVPTARWSVPGHRGTVNRQFIAADPDGYLVRIYAERAQ